MQNHMSDRGANLRLHRSGSGRLVVLIHPTGLDERFWDGCVPYLSKRLEVTTFDRPHHGRHIDGADVPPSEVSTAASFLAWLDERRRHDGPDEADLLTWSLASVREPVHLVGVLDGGLLALRIATDPAGPAVDGVVTLDSVVPGVGADRAHVVDAVGLDDLQELAEIVPAVLRDRDPARYADWFIHRHGLTDQPPRLIATIRGLVTHNAFSSMVPTPPSASTTEADLRSGNPRLLVLQSRNRPAHLRELDEALAAAVPNSRIDVLPHGTSFHPMSDPRDFSERVVRHLLA